MPTPQPSPPRIGFWLQRGSWSLADQWLFSGANFVANILLARWLSLEEYGAFAFVFSIFLFVLSIHSALLTEPMLVLGAARLKDSLQSYFKFLLASHTLVSVIAMLVVALGGLFFFAGQAILFDTVLWMTFGLFFLLLPWLIRPSFNLKLRSDLAAMSSAIYLSVFVGGLFLLKNFNVLSSPSAFATMALASLVSCLPFVPFAKSFTKGKSKQRFAEHLSSQWSYAKWSLPSAISIWTSLNIFYLVLPHFHGLQEVAMFKAVSNLINPLVQSNLALAAFVLPQLSKVHFEEGKISLLAHVRTMVYLFLASSILYFLALLSFGPQLVQLLYGEQYSGLANLIPWAGILPVFMSITAVFANGLRAMEQPNRVFIGYLFGALIAVLLGTWLTVIGSVTGALAGQGLAYVAMVLLLGKYLVHNRERHAHHPRP